jgi:hypothetical protein
MIDLYKENSKKISENTSINIEIILDLENNNPLKETYLKLFLFCYENLKINSPKFEIEPSYFFYYNKENYVNAKATCDNGNYIILISKDLIKRLYENIYSKKTIFSHERLTKYENLSKLINLNLNDLLFQSSTIFTYYHEFAHLVQKKGGDFSFSENTENIFIPESHILEYDADLNGSQFVCAHIINYYETLSSENQNAENLKNLLSIGLAGILIIFLLLHYRELDDDKRVYEFYLNKYSHPHSMIRISYVIRQYQNTALENGIKIEKTEFFKEAFLISNIFFGSNNYISNCLDILEQNFEEIDKNINSLFDESNKRNDLMMQNYMKYNN